MLKEFTDAELESELVTLRRRRAFTARAVELAEQMLNAADERNTACLSRLQFVEGELSSRYTAAAANVSMTPLPSPSDTLATDYDRSLLQGMSQKTEEFVLLHDAATAGAA